MDKDARDRLASLESRLKELDDTKPAAKANSVHVKTSDLSLGFRIATELVAGLIVGVLIGMGLDKLLAWLGYPTRPLMMVIWLFFGFAAGLKRTFELARQSNEIRSQSQGSSKTNDSTEQESDVSDDSGLR